jgi:hypothetical protein
LYETSQEDGKGFTCACGRIYQAAIPIDYMLPCFFLVSKRLQSFAF